MADLNFTLGGDSSELNRAIEEAQKRLEELTKSVIKSNEAINDAKQNLAYLQSFKQLKDSIESVVGSSKQFESSLSSLITKLGSLYAAKQLIQWAEWANNISQTAKAINFTTSELVSFQAAVMQSGGSAQAASRGIEMFYMKLDQARQGGLQQQYAFQRLGITLQDLKKYDDPTLFQMTLKALAELPPSAERNRIEVELLSRSFRGIPLQDVQKQFNETKGTFAQFGPVLDDAGKAYRNLMQDLMNFKIAILSIFQPILKLMGDSTISVQTFQKALVDLASAFVAVRLAMALPTFQAAIIMWKDMTIAVRAAAVALREFSIAEALAANATGLGALLNLVLKLVAGLAIFFGVEAAMNKILNDSAESNKKVNEEKQKEVDNNNKLSTSGQEVYTMYAKMNAAIMEQTKAFKDNIQAQIDNIKSKDATAGLSNEAKAKMDEEIRVREEFRRKIAELNTKLKEAQSARPEDEAYYTQGTLKKAIQDLTAAQDNYVKSAGAAAAIRAKNNDADQMALLLKEDQIKIQKTLADIQVSIDEMTLSSDQKKIANIEKQTNEYIKLATEKRRAQLGVNATDQDLAEDKILQQTIAGIKEKQAAVVDATKKEIDASRDWSNGWKLAFNEYKQNAQDGAATAKKLFDDSTKGMEDAIVNFAKTGKLSFDQLLQTLAEDILRSQIKQLFANMFTAGGLTGGTAGGGSLFGSFGKLLGFADGGTIPTNSPVLVGERGPEIISGAQGMNVTPNGALGTNVTYNINATDARSFQQMIAQDPSFIYAVTLRGQNMIPGAGGL